MRKYECDFCKKNIEKKEAVSFTIRDIYDFDLCERCVNVVRMAVCLKCHGEGKIRVIDEYETNAQSSCGESRTQYKIVKCKHCNG